MSNTTTGSQLTRFIEFLLRWILKTHRPSTESNRKGSRYINIDDALLCARLSAYYQEVVLTKQHSSSVRVLHRSKCIQADQELKNLMSQIPELSNYDLRTGDPGFYLLKTRVIEAPDTTNRALDSTLLDSTELETLFETVVCYSFYKRHKKKMPLRFQEAESEMRKIVEQFHVPGRFSWRTFSSSTRPKREKVNTSFMDEYGSSFSSLKDQDNRDYPKDSEVSDSAI